jgi:hypothetical protein
MSGIPDLTPRTGAVPEFKDVRKSAVALKPEAGFAPKPGTSPARAPVPIAATARRTEAIRALRLIGLVPRKHKATTKDVPRAPSLRHTVIT